ncbi:MAG: hypothetical protein HQ534_03520 [Armatimonadetes bacterium]|nr:hypothetical protein [Armatimonadota bacterium]
MEFVVFDDKCWRNFFPITLTRSTGDLRVGILKLRQRIASYFALEETNVIISEKLKDIYQERHSDWQINTLKNIDTIFINSRLKTNEELKKKILSLPENSCLLCGDDILAARFIPEKEEVSTENISSLFENLKEIQIKEDCFWKYIWELISENSDYILHDFKEYFFDKDNYFETETGVTVLNPYNVWIGEGTEIKPGVVIDATEGPVILDENVKIMSNSVIIGPVYIGKKSIIKMGAKIYQGTSVGPVCKIGGEIEETIIQGFSNKQHDGFLGHSYLGEWINLGADTNNSNLKNNYKNVKIYFYPKKEKVDSKCQFLGSIIGDHSKTAINSTINAGAVIGVGCNLFGSDAISDFVPSFSWGMNSKYETYQIDKFFETANLIKQRRNLNLTDNEKELYTKISQQNF